MTRRYGCVFISNNDLAAKCDHCLEVLAYQVGSHMTADAFKKLMTEFVRKHNKDCGNNSTTDEKKSGIN